MAVDGLNPQQMNQQRELKQPIGDLLDSHSGELREEGWARTSLVWSYDRTKALRCLSQPPPNPSFYDRYCRTLKEWDYYSLISHEGRFGICLTLADLGGVASLASIVFLDLDRGFQSQADSVRLPWIPLTKQRTGIGLPERSFAGCSTFNDSTVQISYDWTSEDGMGILSFAAGQIKNADGDQGLIGRIVLRKYEEESMTIATSWGPGQRSYYYYNQKVNNITIEGGGFCIGKRSYQFNSRLDYAALDWGRGVWTYRNRWFWSSISCTLGDGKRFGWNLGYGFSDRSAATENCLMYDGKVHKLDQVEFVYDEKDYLRPWKITSNDGRLEIDFIPILDRNFALNLLLVKSIQHQVFGRFSGFAILDDGTKLHLKDVLGFAEDVLNWW